MAPILKTVDLGLIPRLNHTSENVDVNKINKVLVLTKDYKNKQYACMHRLDLSAQSHARIGQVLRFP